MTASAGGTEVERFRRVLADRFGWTFSDSDEDRLLQVLRRRADVHGVDRRTYLRRLAGGRKVREFATLAEDLTVTESYFFRNVEQFDALAATVLPRLIRARARQRRLRLFSVGCSSGEEAYTLAIVAHQVVADPSWDISVLGVDANQRMLSRAAGARYPTWSLRETPAPQLRRWFRERGGELEVDPAIREHVRFLRRNVIEDDPVLWQPDQYDVIFCRNLLMYLTREAANRLVARLTEALAPDGYLFLGHTDTLGNRPAKLEPRHSEAAFYYRRRSDPPADIRGGLAPPAHIPVPPAPTVARAAAGADERVVELLREEHFSAAAAATADAAAADAAAADAAAADAATGQVSPDRLMLHGVALAPAGRLDEAALVCRRLVAVDGLNADAHHLLGMCLEAGAEPDAAATQYRLAAYLDPTFAMPRLRIGLLARRRDDAGTAGDELRHAHQLLHYETDERVLFFGGGFGRMALVSLCRRELDVCGTSR